MALLVLYRVSKSERFDRIYRTRKLRGRNDQGEIEALSSIRVDYIVSICSVNTNSLYICVRMNAKKKGFAEWTIDCISLQVSIHIW